ncbi:hypothetical protein [Microcoleus sp. AT3-D2]
MKKYTFGCCDSGKSADSYNGVTNYVPSITKQVNGTQQISKAVNSIN